MSVMGVEPIRVWIDDRNAIFRRGLLSSVLGEGLLVVGESCRFRPEPETSSLDILVFDLEGTGVQNAVRAVAGGAVQLVAIAEQPREEHLFDAVEAGLAAFLIRSELTPESLVTCLRSVSCGNNSLPSSLLASLLEGLAKGGRRGATAGQLARRELDVLRLLAAGGDTREIAGELSYSERTVKNIVHEVLVKLNCRTRAQAVALATRQGFI